MFWKETTRLKDVSTSSKIAISLFLIICGIGYLFGFFNILLSYSPIDQEKGLSIRDIQIAFYGARESTVLEGSIDGTMKEYFESEGDYQANLYRDGPGPRESVRVEAGSSVQRRQTISVQLKAGGGFVGRFGKPSEYTK